MNVAGPEDRRDMALTSNRVVSMRLSVMSRLRESVQRVSAIGAPARLMTASARSRACSHGPMSRAFHSTACICTSGR